MSPLDLNSNSELKLPIPNDIVNQGDQNSMKSAADALIRIGMEISQINNKKKRTYDHLPFKDVPISNLRKRTRTSPPELKLYQSVTVTPKISAAELLWRYRHREERRNKLHLLENFESLRNEQYVQCKKLENRDPDPKISNLCKGMENNSSLKLPPKC